MDTSIKYIYFCTKEYDLLAFMIEVWSRFDRTPSGVRVYYCNGVEGISMNIQILHTTLSLSPIQTFLSSDI
jgi:hypothetical protein